MRRRKSLEELGARGLPLSPLSQAKQAMLDWPPAELRLAAQANLHHAGMRNKATGLGISFTDMREAAQFILDEIERRKGMKIGDDSPRE